MHYTIVNAHSKPDGSGGNRFIQGIEAFFKPISDQNQMGEFDPHRFVNGYVEKEIVSGRLEWSDDEDYEVTKEKAKTKVLSQIRTFIENHQDFRSGIIWTKPTNKELAQRLVEQKERLEKEIDSLVPQIKDPEKITKEQVAEMTKPKPNAGDELVTGGGIIKGGSSIATARGSLK